MSHEEKPQREIQRHIAISDFPSREMLSHKHRFCRVRIEKAERYMTETWAIGFSAEWLMPCHGRVTEPTLTPASPPARSTIQRANQAEIYGWAAI